MKKIFKLITIIISIIALNSCGSVKDGFSSQKKDSLDEFLVKKKSPLIMPPSFNELPVPQESSQMSKSVDEKDLKSLIIDKKTGEQDNQNLNQNINFENSIIDKIKNN